MSILKIATLKLFFKYLLLFVTFVCVLHLMKFRWHRPGRILLSMSREDLYDKIFNIRKKINQENFKFLPTGALIGGHEIVNKHPFNYVLNNPNLCPKDQKLLFVAYVHTAPEHHKRRMVIRQTWGNNKYYKDQIRVVFVMGLGNSSVKAAEQALLFEAEQYGDIVQEDFVDSYHNLTYKAIAGLRWISMNCRNASFVLKTDDDIFVNSFNLVRNLRNLKPPRFMIRCIVWYGMKVERQGKWKVSVEEYKHDTYPEYCSGSAFVLTMDTVLKLYNASFYVPFFWVDDLYTTGFLPLYSGGVNFISAADTYLLNGKNLLSEFLSSTGLKKYVFSHVHDLKLFLKVWNRVVKIETNF